MLKEDNLGLGARSGQAEGREFGLGGFQDLLGRLNGKSEVKLEKEKEARLELGRKLYAEQRWGPSRFVRGGLLVGDKIEDEKPISTEVVLKKEEDEPGVVEVLIKKEEEEEDDEEIVGWDLLEQRTKVRQEKREKTEKKNKHRDSTLDTTTTKPGVGTTLATTTANIKGEASPESSATDHKESKEERRQRKLQRRAKKEAKRLAKSTATPTSSTTPSQTGTSTPTTAVVIKTDGLATPQSGTSTPLGGGLAVRQRYLRQKRMAMMDPNALREVFHVRHVWLEWTNPVLDSDDESRLILPRTSDNERPDFPSNHGPCCILAGGSYTANKHQLANRRQHDRIMSVTT